MKPVKTRAKKVVSGYVRVWRGQLIGWESATISGKPLYCYDFAKDKRALDDEHGEIVEATLIFKPVFRKPKKPTFQVKPSNDQTQAHK